MGVTTLEKAPNGLHEPWLGIWRASLRAMQAQGTWNPALRPLLDLYIFALAAAEQARAAGYNMLLWTTAVEDIDGLEELTQQEIANELGIGEEAVSSRIRRFRRSGRSRHRE